MRTRVWLKDYLHMHLGPSSYTQKRNNTALYEAIQFEVRLRGLTRKWSFLFSTLWFPVQTTSPTDRTGVEWPDYQTSRLRSCLTYSFMISIGRIQRRQFGLWSSKMAEKLPDFNLKCHGSVAIKLTLLCPLFVESGEWLRFLPAAARTPRIHLKTSNRHPLLMPTLLPPDVRNPTPPHSLSPPLHQSKNKHRIDAKSREEEQTTYLSHVSPP